MLYKPSPKLVELCQPVHPLVFNCLFCLAQREVHTLSLGASCPADFDLQVSTLEHLDRSSVILPTIIARLREALVDTVGSDLADRYAEGLPDWENTPGFMNIPAMLWLRNLALAFDMQEFAKTRYNLLGNGSHWFPGSNAAHLDELDIEKAIQSSPFAEQIPDWLRECHAKFYTHPQKRVSQS